MMKLLGSLCTALLVVTLAAGEEKKDTKFDAAKLVGDWTYVSGMKAGDKVEKDMLKGTVNITKDNIALPAGDEKFNISYKLDTSKSPVTLDMEIKDGPFKGGKAVGLITLSGDQLTICYVPQMDDSAKRPTKLESTKENNAHLYMLKRASK